jgi:hypothetical protein
VERIGPYATQGLQWVGFDDSKMIREKSQFIMDQGFGGGMIWALDLVKFFMIGSWKSSIWRPGILTGFSCNL